MVRRELMSPVLYGGSSPRLINAEDYDRIDFDYLVKVFEKDGVRRDRLPLPRNQPHKPTSRHAQSSRWLPILFDFRSSLAGSGVPLFRCLTLQPDNLRGLLVEPDSPIFERHTCHELTLQFFWPTYINEPISMNVPLHFSRGICTRAHLARSIAQPIEVFMKSCSASSARERGYWAISREPNGEGISISDVRLSALYNISDGVWRADLHVHRHRDRIPKGANPHNWNREGTP